MKTTVETFFDDISSFKNFKEDEVKGVYNGRKFSLTYDDSQRDKFKELYGNIRLAVFDKEATGSEGGCVLYSELHLIPENLSALFKLFTRGKEIASKLNYDDGMHKCPYCGFLVLESWRTLNTISFSRKPIKRAITTKKADTCAGVSSIIPPKVEVYEHKNKNPFYSQSELEDCESLCLTKGYPERSNSAIDYSKRIHIETLLEEHPDRIKSELDIETIEYMLAYLNWDDEEITKLTEN